MSKCHTSLALIMAVFLASPAWGEPAQPHEVFSGVDEFSLQVNVSGEDQAALKAGLGQKALVQHVGRWMDSAGFRMVAKPNRETGATLSVSVLLEKSPDTGLYAVALRSTVWQLVVLPNEKSAPAITWENRTALIVCDADGLKQVPAVLDQYLAPLVTDYKRANPQAEVKLPKR